MISKSIPLVLLLALLVTAAPALGQGACCLFDDSCAPAADEPSCNAMNGVFLAGADRASAPCSTGACCIDLNCNETTAYACIAAGRVFAGAGVTCLDDPCEANVGACCLGGACSFISPIDCDGIGGTWLGAGTDCVTDQCVLGACCAPGSCTENALYECADAGGAFFEGLLCMDDPCTIPDQCPINSLFSQNRDEPDSFDALVSEDSADLRRFDDFSGVAGAIEGVVWWGLDLEFNGVTFLECTETVNDFEISFFEDAAGAPGALVCSYTLTASRTPTGILYQGTELNEYAVTLPVPCVLVDGWISIVGLGDADCWFLWMGSTDGDGRSICDNCTESIEPRDVSVCLIGMTGGVFGACCNQSTGGCADAVEITDCLAPGLRFVPDTLCADLAPPCGIVDGACCFADGNCFIDLAEPCVAAGGEWLGALTDCTLCPEVGACCFSPEICTLETEFDCTIEGSTWLGPLTSCDDCPDVPVCPVDALFGQGPEGPDGFEAGSSEVSAGFRRFDDFSGVAGAIHSITFWGVDLDNIEGTNDFLECEESDPTFEISFHVDAGGQPGAEVCSDTLLATRTPTGLQYLGTELNEYTVTLPTPCVLTNGWISIVGVGDPECWFLWMSAAIGDSWCDGCNPSPQDLDLAFCLHGPVGGVFGACCDDALASCTDGVEIIECVASDLRFVPDTLCQDLNPACGVVLGACCFDDGSACIVQTAVDCAGDAGTWLGANTICAACPCIVPCPPGAVAEGEVDCFDDYIDTTNGGCASSPPVFGTLALGDTVCGSSGAFLDGLEFVGDFDWYRVNVPFAMDLKWTAEAEFRPIIGIFDASLGCPGVQLVASAAFECTTVSVVESVGPGNYWVVIGPLSATDSAACPSAYTATVEQDIPCLGDTNDDGFVDIDDIVNVILDFGTDGSGHGGDVDGSGLVDIDDVVLVVLNFGDCGT